MFFIIYKTTCLINNKFYIGMHKTNNIEDDYLGSGKVLKKSIRKYGKENFKREILHCCNSLEEMRQKELEVVTPELLKDPLCMNLTCGGHGGFYYLNNVVRTREMAKLANEASHKARKRNFEENPDYREVYVEKMRNLSKKLWEDPNIRERMIVSSRWNGKKHSEESKKKISQANSERIGSKNPTYNTYWISKDGVNKRIKKEDLQFWLDLNWVKGKNKSE